MMMLMPTRMNKRTAPQTFRSVAYLLAGVLLLFALAACDPMMGNMDNNGGDNNGGPTDVTVGTASLALERFTGTAANGFAVQAEAGETAALTVDLSAETVTGKGGSFEGDTFVGILNLIGGNGINTFTGNAEANSFTGGTAPDVFDGAAGNDTLDGKGGNDTLTGGAGTDTALYAASTTPFTIASTGTAPDISYTVNGGNANGMDTLTGIETIQLSNGDDTVGSISTAASGITIDGGEGTDTITVANEGATLTLLNVETITGGTGDDTITGGAGAETMSGGGGTNILNGGGGNDTFIAGTGTDTFDGGGGTDTIDYSADTASVTVDLSSTSGIFSSIENIIGGSGDDTFTGTAEANSFTGGGGNDTVHYATSATPFTITSDSTSYTVNGGAENGTDTLTGIETIQFSEGADAIENLSMPVSGITIDGGAGTGTDTIMLANETAGVTADLSNYTGFETITGGTGPDTITGSTSTETINGGTGNDTFTVSGGGDTLNGDADDDTFVLSRNENATVKGGTGSDTIDLTAMSGSTFSVDVNLSNATVEGIAPGVTVSEGVDVSGTRVQVTRASVSLDSIESIRFGALQTDIIGNDEANVVHGASSGTSISFRGNGGDDVLHPRNGTYTFYDFANDDLGDNNDKIDFSTYHPDIRFEDLEFTVSLIGVQLSIGPVPGVDFLGIFADDGALSSTNYTGDRSGNVAATNGITAAFELYKTDPTNTAALNPADFFIFGTE